MIDCLRNYLWHRLKQLAPAVLTRRSARRSSSVRNDRIATRGSPPRRNGSGDPMSLRFTSVPMQNGQFIWRLHSSENELLARAGTGYDTFVSAQRAATLFKAASPGVWFVVYVNAVGEWRWRACRSHVNLARSGKAFPTKLSAERVVARVRMAAGSATGA